MTEAVILIAASLGITNEESDTKQSDRLSLSSLLLIVSPPEGGGGYENLDAGADVPKCRF